LGPVPVVIIIIPVVVITLFRRRIAIVDQVPASLQVGFPHGYIGVEFLFQEMIHVQQAGTQVNGPYEVEAVAFRYRDQRIGGVHIGADGHA
jgi:hypothetical protein